MKHRIIYLFLVVVLAAALIESPVRGVQAKPPAQSSQAQVNGIPGLDLIVLLDQSGSMKGSSGYKATDPDNRRIYTTQYLIDYLAFDNKYVNTDRNNSVVVIGFGSTAATQVSRTEMTDENRTREAKDHVIPLDLGNTDFVAALGKVREVYPKETDKEVESGMRQRMIVIITDGGPWTEEQKGVKEYFADIYKAYSETYDLSNYPMYVICIDDSDRYWPEVGPLWNEFTKAEKVENINEVNRYIADQLCSLLNPADSTSSCRLQQLGDHFIQPYSTLVSFSFFKYGNGDKVVLQRPDQSTVVLDPRDRDVLDHQFTPRDEMIVISNPQSGCWNSSSPDNAEAKVDVIAQVKFNDLRLTKPASSHPQALPLLMEFELRDKQGNFVDEDPNFPVLIESHLEGPDNIKQEIKIERAKDASGNPIPGKYVSTKIPDLKMKGNYQLVVTGYSTPVNINQLRCLKSNDRIRVFENKYTIPVISPGLQVSNPGQPFMQYSPIMNLALNYVGEEGNRLDIPDAAPWQMHLKASAPSGKEIDLPDPVLSGGAFMIQGPIVLPEVGEYTIRSTLVNKDTGLDIYAVNAKFRTAANPVIVSPSPNQPLNGFLPQVRIKLTDMSGTPVAPSGDYPLRLVCQLIQPGGQAIFETPFNGTEDPSEYQAEINKNLNVEGEYQVLVIGYQKLSAAEEIQVFDQPIPIKVTSNLPYFNVITPAISTDLTSPSTYRLHMGVLPIRSPMEFKVEVKRGSAAIAPAEVFTNDPNSLVTVEVRNKAGKHVLKEALPLGSDKKTLILKTDKLQEAGEYTATIHFSGSVVGGLAAENTWAPVTVTFARADPAWVAWLWTGLIILAALALLAAAAWYGGEHFFLDKAKGILVAEYVGKNEPIWEYPLTRRNRHTIKIGKESSSLRVKKITVVGLKSRQLGRGDDQIVSVRIEAVDNSGKAVARGKLDASEKHQSPPVPCTQSDVNERRYQFRLRI